MAGGTILKLGYTNPLTDTFGAHPLLGSVIDLNDGVTFTLASPAGLELDAPPRSLLLAGNIRTQGEIATRAITRHNRTVTARLIVGPASSSAALISAIRNLLLWLAAPPQLPMTLQYQPFNASTPLYLDIVGASHNLPADEGQWLRGQFEPLTISFITRPGLRGNRVTLQNLVSNPGFEQPSGSAVTVFSDSFANANAYNPIVGSAPTVASQVMTIPTGTFAQFGSPVWGAVSQWQIRFQLATGMNAGFALHLLDGSNLLWVNIASSGTFALIHTIGGVNNTLASSAQTYTNGTFYWLRITQFPSVANNPPDLVVTLFNDSGGTVGTQKAQITAPAFDALTALVEPPCLICFAGTMKVGGTGVNNSNTVSLFAPGGWSFFGTASGSTGMCSGAVDGSSAGAPTSANLNTFTGGPVTSFGAARIDLPPAGTVVAGWTPYAGGAPTGALTAAIPASAGQTLVVGCFTKSLGLHATHASITLLVNEYDANGSFLRQDTISAALGGATNGSVSWVNLSGGVILGASCAYVAVVLQVADTSVAGESAGAAVWFDNVQCWNLTTTGILDMPYCELRFPQSPATLVISGLVGDLPAPCSLALGTFVTSLPTGGALSLYVGRKAVTSPRAQLVGASYGAFSAAFSPQGFAQLDASSYGGFDSFAAVGAGGWNPKAFSLLASDAAGIYHLLARVKTAQTVPNLPNITLRVVTAQQTDPWFNQVGGADIVGQWAGGYVTPFAAQNTWTIADAGQCNLPPFPQGALTDPSQLYLIPRSQWQDTSGGGAQNGFTNWQALLPIDGSLIVASVNNPSNAAGAITTSWLWTYADGLLLNRSAASDGPAWTYSVESKPQPNPAVGAGGSGTQSSGAINVNSGADPCLTVDPAQVGANGSVGVNQIVAIVSDQAGGVYACFGEVSYSPLYLEPR